MHARNRILGFCLTFFAAISTLATAEETALDRYIAKPDDSFAWRVDKSIPGEGQVTHVIDLTSQTWRSEKEVDRPVWKHWLTVAVPNDVKHDTGMLYITGGDNDDDAPENAPERFVNMALETNSIVAELRMVPNQPLHFADSRNHGRYEDDLIAYSRVKYIVTGDEEWLARLPMVKSAVSAMTAIQEFAKTEEAGRHTVEEFVVAGGSKRAWTTWLTGVVDERVSAIIPLVIDALNTEAITRHHFEAYGFFSTALGDYVRHGLYPGALGTPVFNAILRIEDPYMYRDRERLKIPKYVINASGDQYFLPDNSQFYFLDMPDEKHLRYVPNAKHNLAGSDARESMMAFYKSILRDTPRPQFTWSIENREHIVVDVEDQPVEINLWQATNPEARDFRLDTIGKAWTKTTLSSEFPKRYIASIDIPAEGYTAFFVELVYDSGFDEPFKFTTDVLVLPDVLPYTLDENSEIVMK